MGWAEKRIEEYRNGEEPGFLEKRALEHAEPVNCAASILGFLLLLYGLWMHDFFFIGLAVLVGILGHVVSWTK